MFFYQIFSLYRALISEITEIDSDAVISIALKIFLSYGVYLSIELTGVSFISNQGHSVATIL